MKQKNDISKMSEEQLIDFQIQSSMELADLTRAILELQKESRNVCELLEEADLCLENFESKKISKNNKLS